MDNLAHSLVGLAVSKAGLERLSPATSAVCLIAANAPDADIVTVVFGRWTYLHHHRGITHSIVGTLILAFVVPLLFFAGDRILARIRKKPPSVKLLGLTIASLVASATHPFMDWTNNYGVRPLLPWSSKWFYGDLVFIVDPLIWLVVGGSVFLLTSSSRKQLLFWGLVGVIVSYLIMFGVSRPGMDVGWFRLVWPIALVSLIALRTIDVRRIVKNRIALAGLGLLVTYWCGLAVLHKVAVKRVQQESVAIAQNHGEQVMDLAAMPTLLNPFFWQAVVETDRAAYRFDVHLTQSSSTANLVRYERPEVLEPNVMSKALQDYRAQVFLDFARFPVAKIAGADCTTQTLVQLADLRYTEPGRQRGTFTLEVPVECPANLARAGE
jgi:inner membrane protein